MSNATMSTDRVDVLDWLRALAIALVVFGHSNRPMAPGGAVGVSIFFVLSGYLIASILMRDGMMTIRNISSFAIRRIARIYPMYIISISFLCLFFYLKQPENLEKVVPELVSILTLHNSAEEWVGYGFGVLWTLVVEFGFYITFPFLLWIGLTSKHLLTVLLCVVFFSFFAKIFKFGGNTILYYDHFLIGAIAFIAMSRNIVPAFFRRREIVYAGIALIAMSAIFPYQGARDMVWYAQSFMAAIGTALIIMYSKFFPIGFSLPVVSFIGRISYSVYLVHAIVLDVKPEFQSNIPAFLICVVLCSFFTYRFIEQPVIRMVHQRVKFSFPT